MAKFKISKIVDIFLCLFLLQGCSNQVRNNMNVIEKGKNYEIEQSDDLSRYKFTLFSDDGSIYWEEISYKLPDIEQLNDLLKISISGGTYADQVRYFDPINKQLSRYFQNPYLEYENLVVYYEEDKLIIQDIFDTTKYYKSFDREISYSEPPQECIIINNGKNLEITYRKDYESPYITEILDL